jgi:26S proteasome regulatory subunit N2
MIHKIKKDIGGKNSTLHGASIWSNAVMNAFTTNDSFLSDNIAWVSNATNWSRFNATACLGLIHYGNKKDAMSILQPYFTGIGAGPDQVNSPYSTAGAYFAYGLIHANHHQEETVNYFMDGYRNSGMNEAVQHGVSLGLGLVAMATKK